MLFTMVEENFNLFFWSRSFVKPNTETYGIYAHLLPSCKKKKAFVFLDIVANEVFIGHLIQNSEKAL